MSSNINYNIDEKFPIAGKSNDSQGFRDNFTNIKNSLIAAKSEIEDLQNKAIFKQAITGTTLNNNMNGVVLGNVQLQGASDAQIDFGTTSGTVNLDFSLANVFKVTTNGAVSITFANWPLSGQYGCIRLHVVISNLTDTLTVPVVAPGVTGGLTDVVGASLTTGIITFAALGEYVFEFTTSDYGQNVMISDLTRGINKSYGNLTIQGNVIYSAGSINTAYWFSNTRATGATLTSNVLYRRFYIDSASSATLSTQTINLPLTAEDGRELAFTALCPITTTTWTGGGTVRWVPTNVFSSGNVTVNLQYNLAANIWMRA